jgi:hypothetical protein
LSVIVVTSHFEDYRGSLWQLRSLLAVGMDDLPRTELADTEPVDGRIEFSALLAGHRLQRIKTEVLPESVVNAPNRVATGFS